MLTKRTDLLESIIRHTSWIEELSGALRDARENGDYWRMDEIEPELERTRVSLSGLIDEAGWETDFDNLS